MAVASAAEFPSPDDQRIVEEPALLQVAHQRRRGLIGLLALDANVLRQVVMMVPVLMVKLHEPDTALDEPPRQQTIGRKGAGIA